MECVNRVYSYLTKSMYVKALSLENESKVINTLYVIVDNEFIQDVNNDIIKFCLGNNLFTLVEYKKDELVFVSNDFVNLKIVILNELSLDITSSILFNPDNLKVSDEQLSLRTLTISMNQAIIELGNYLTYTIGKDKVQAFNSLAKVNDHIVSYMFAYYLKRINKSLINELIYVLPKDVKLKFSNYLSILQIDKIVECSKMILWFVNDFITNLPIVIAPRINIDYYYDIKKKILDQ